MFSAGVHRVLVVVTRPKMVHAQKRTQTITVDLPVNLLLSIPRPVRRTIRFCLYSVTQTHRGHHSLIYRDNTENFFDARDGEIIFRMQLTG